MELKRSLLLRDNLIAEMREKLKANNVYIPKATKFSHSSSQLNDDMDYAENYSSKPFYLSDNLGYSSSSLKSSSSEWTLAKEFEAFTVIPKESDIQKIWSPVLVAEPTSCAAKISEPFVKVSSGDNIESFKCLTQKERSSYRVMIFNLESCRQDCKNQ
jgi:hypothetical protein